MLVDTAVQVSTRPSRATADRMRGRDSWFPRCSATVQQIVVLLPYSPLPPQLMPAIPQLTLPNRIFFHPILRPNIAKLCTCQPKIINDQKSPYIATSATLNRKNLKHKMEDRQFEFKLLYPLVPPSPCHSLLTRTNLMNNKVFRRSCITQSQCLPQNY